MRAVCPGRKTSPRLLKGIGLLEIIGALGLILPLITGIAPALTPAAGLGLAVVMLGAVVVHQRRHEPVIPPAVLAVLSIAAAVLGFVILAR
ncbi:DoxX family protein [Pseudarthrobacter enclensis]|uniref:DoxX family protein n=1 Tax=Pseudarthrobacter enclensis TaxID=993070 RepID=UPI000A5CA545|nr:DoxX family protein [Pseudarthrobacter enclensis]